MKFIVDFHIHSRFSRATAKTLDFENLYMAAQIKGITVVGTGDFTHPAWFDEIKNKLAPAEEGLFTLKESISKSENLSKLRHHFDQKSWVEISQPNYVIALPS